MESAGVHYTYPFALNRRRQEGVREGRRAEPGERSVVQHDCYISTRSMTKRVKTCKNASIVPPVTSTTVSVILSRPGATARALPPAGRRHLRSEQSRPASTGL